MTNSTLYFDPLILKSRPFGRNAPVETDADREKQADWLRMDTNENAVGTSPKVIAAVQEDAQRLSAYPAWDGERRLRLALAEMHNDWANDSGQLTEDHFVVGNGGMDVLEFIVNGFIRSGDELIMSYPTFRFQDIVARRLGAKIINVPLDDAFGYDVEAVLAAVTDRTKVIYACNPNNPTGNIISAAKFDYLMQHVPKHVLVVSDEAYCQFVDDTDFPDTRRYIHAERNLLQLFSFSKVFGLAGLRLGYGVARPEIAEYLARLKRPFHLGRLTVAAGLTAVADQEHVQKTIQTIISGRGWLTKQLQELGIQVTPSQGNFLLLAAGIPAETLTAQLKQHGIIVSSGQQRFGLPDHIRVTVGLPQQNQRFIEAIAKVLKNIRR